MTTQVRRLLILLHSVKNEKEEGKVRASLPQMKECAQSIDKLLAGLDTSQPAVKLPDEPHKSAGAVKKPSEEQKTDEPHSESNEIREPYVEVVEGDMQKEPATIKKRGLRNQASVPQANVSKGEYHAGDRNRQIWRARQ